MRAVRIDQWTEPSNLTVSDAPEPRPGDHELLIEVKAAGCNFFDTLIVQGKYQTQPPFPFSPGGEVAGIVRETGVHATGFAVGDRVMARIGYGGFAEWVAAPVSACQKMPETLSFEQGAAFPIVYGTAYAAVVTRGCARAGETVLVTAAAGGVGLAAVQVATAVGARVIALAGGDKLGITREHGAQVAIDYRVDGWFERVLQATDGRGADVIVENVGGDVFDGCMRCIAWGGRLVTSGFASGKIPLLKINRVLLKHISVVGLHFGPMLEHEPETVFEIQAALQALFEQGQIRPVVSATFPLERVADALEALGNRRTIGKVVLTL